MAEQLRPTEKPFANPALRLGFGCTGAWGEAWFSERRAAALVDKAIQGGVVHFDTGAFYAGGEAERRLGRILRAHPGEALFISTKTGTRYDRFRRPRKDFSPASIRRDVEQSLARLGVERLDLLYLHGPTPAQISETREVLGRMKQEGKIAADGVCGWEESLEAGVEAGAEAIMGVYNLFERRHGGVFQRARARGVHVVAIAPLAQGLYARGFFAPRAIADFWKLARAIVKNPAELRRARAARHELESAPNWTPAQLALAFTLANKDIDVALTTTTKLAHLQESILAAARTLEPRLLERLSGLDGPRPGA